MTISRLHHSVFSITITILTAAHCLAYPLLSSRSEGTSVLSVNSAALASPKGSSSSSPSIIPGWHDSTAIVFFVAVASVVLTVPMFVYIWMRRRRLHAARERSRNQQGEAEAKAKAEAGAGAEARVEEAAVVDGLQKGGAASILEAPLVAVVKKESVGAERKGRARKESVGTGRKRSAGRASKKGSVTFVQSVQVSVKSTRAVEIMVKPAKVSLRDPTWEKLKS